MTRSELDIEKIKIVHGLLGGEADDDTWHGFLHHDGLPDWHERLSEKGTRDGQKVAIEYCTIYSDHPYLPPKVLADDPDDDTSRVEWHRTSHFRCSGEAECPRGGIEESDLDGPASCLYCEDLVMGDSHHYEMGTRDKYVDPSWWHGDMQAFTTFLERRRASQWRRDGHGYIYIGDCFAAIYEKWTPICFLCDEEIEPDNIEESHECACGLSHHECAHGDENGHPPHAIYC